VRKILKFLTLLYFLNIACYCLGNAILRGKVVLQNSGGKSVRGVKISAFGATHDYSKDRGFFELIFPDKKPGDTVVLDAKKKGLEVVNRDKLNVVLRQNPDDLVEIVMCKEGDRDRYAAEYYDIAINAIDENFSKQVEELKKKYNVNTNQLKAELIKLSEQKDAALAQVKELAEKFARVNFDNATDLNKKFFHYFNKGDIDKSLALLEDAKIEMGIRKEKEELNQWIASYRYKAWFYISRLQFDKAESYYEKAVEADPANLKNLFEFIDFLYKQKQYMKSMDLINRAFSSTTDDNNRATLLNYLGLFYHKQNRFTKALRAYSDSLVIRRKLAKENPNTYLPDVAMTLNNLGNLYLGITRFSDALKCFSESLEIRRKIAKENPNAYLPDVAMTLNNLGSLYLGIARFPDALKCFSESLEIRRKIAKENPNTYLPDVAMTLNNLGNLYLDIANFPEALKYFNESLDIRKKIAEVNPDAHLPDFAMTLNNLGNLYLSIARFPDALKCFNESLAIRRKLAKENPNAYLPYVGMTLNNLGNLYLDIASFSDALKCFQESLAIRKKLVAENPYVYLPDEAMTLNNLGILYKSTTRFPEALKSYSEALEIYRKLAKENPNAYQPDVAMTLNNLGILYKSTTRFPEALKSYSEALEIYRKLAKENPNAYQPDVAMTLNNLGILYKATTRFPEALKSYSEALEIYRKLAKENPNAYQPDVVMTLNNLGLLHLAQNKFPDALSALNETLEIREKLAKNNPVFNLDVSNTLITLALYYILSEKSSGQAPGEKALPLLNRAITILKKFPDVPKAQSLTKIANQLKKAFEKPPAEKKNEK